MFNFFKSRTSPFLNYYVKGYFDSLIDLREVELVKRERNSKTYMLFYKGGLTNTLSFDTEKERDEEFFQVISLLKKLANEKPVSPL